MSLTINVPLTTKDGGSVATGSFAQFDVYFPTEGGKYNTNISIWRSQTAKDDGLRTVNPVEISRLSFEKELTLEEFAALTPVTIHQDVKAFLEGFVGADNVVIN